MILELLGMMQDTNCAVDFTIGPHLAVRPAGGDRNVNRVFVDIQSQCKIFSFSWPASLVVALSRYDLNGSHSLTHVARGRPFPFKHYVYVQNAMLEIGWPLHLVVGRF